MHLKYYFVVFLFIIIIICFNILKLLLEYQIIYIEDDYIFRLIDLKLIYIRGMYWDNDLLHICTDNAIYTMKSINLIPIHDIKHNYIFYKNKFNFYFFYFLKHICKQSIYIFLIVILFKKLI